MTETKKGSPEGLQLNSLGQSITTFHSDRQGLLYCYKCICSGASSLTLLSYRGGSRGCSGLQGLD